MVRVGIGLPDICVIPWRLNVGVVQIFASHDVKGPLILDVRRVASRVETEVTKDVHMPLALRHNLPVGIARPLMPCQAANQLSELVVMLYKLCKESGHRGFSLEVGMCE